MFSVRRAVLCSAGVFATLALSTGIASAGPILDYQLTTAGCFNCTTAGSFTDVASYSGYTFDGVTMSNGVTDASGNVGTATAKVFVPQSQGSGPAVDSGPHYVVLGSCP